MGEQDVVYPWDGILCSLDKDGQSDTGDSVDAPGRLSCLKPRHKIMSRNHVTKGQILYDCPYWGSLESSALETIDGRHQGLGERAGTSCLMGTGFSLGR